MKFHMDNLVRFTKRSRIEAPVEELFKWHARPGAISRLSPPWDPLRLIESVGGIEAGARVAMKMKAGPLGYTWRARHTDYLENRMFADIQEQGPFSKWQHTHRFEPDGPHAAFLEDRIDFRLPFHILSHPLASGWVLNKLERIFAYRHETTALDLKDHLAGQHLKPMNILVAGVGGVIGSALIPFLTTGAHRVVRLVRRKPVLKNNEAFWNPDTGEIDLSGIGPVDAAILLSGDNIGSGRWTAAKKKIIVESRINTTRTLARALLEMKPAPRAFLSASAIGYYGHSDDRCFVENDPPGSDFISTVCRRWETAAADVAEAGIRTASLRIGVVLTPAGGALARLLTPHSFRIGVKKMGHGSQVISWVGMDDVLGAILHILGHDDLSGPVNLVSPEPVTHLELNLALAEILNRPALLSLPARLIRLLFGQMGKEVLLSGACVKPKKLLDTGYCFRYPDLDDALRHVLGTNRLRPSEKR